VKQKELMTQVTEKIVQMLSEGDVERWTKPWRQFGAPRNLLTGRRYSGPVNLLLLQLSMMKSDFQYPAWATYLQIQEAGGHVLSGQKATTIVFWKPLDNENQAPAEQTEISKDNLTEPAGRKPGFVLQQFSVFNLDQTNLDAKETLQRLGMELRPLTTDAEVEAFISKMGAHIIHRGDSAHYDRRDDKIVMPLREAFQSIQDYYSTVMHELVHWTGHANRLNRNLDGHFGSENYAREEIIAELGSLYLCSELGIAGKLQHKEYLHSWLSILKKDCREIFRLSGKAQEAAEWLLNQSLQKAA
jgi:antirestriction protein ArdC